MRYRASLSKPSSAPRTGRILHCLSRPSCHLCFDLPSEYAAAYFLWCSHLTADGVRRGKLFDTMVGAFQSNINLITVDDVGVDLAVATISEVDAYSFIFANEILRDLCLGVLQHYDAVGSVLHDIVALDDRDRSNRDDAIVIVGDVVSADHCSRALNHKDSLTSAVADVVLHYHAIVRALPTQSNVHAHV